MNTIDTSAPGRDTANLAGDSFAHWLDLHLPRVEKALELFVRADASNELEKGMRYGVLGGGKRLRAMLVLAAQQAVATDAEAGAEAAMRSACAVELLHAYSLMHDDMPCMDNDVLRRGKPTVHVEFGEATALLAGDAMQALAFELLTPTEVKNGEPLVAPAVQARLCGLLARAAGPAGMAGGQAIDLAHVGQTMGRDKLQQMHELKTGALLQGSVMMGAHCVQNVSSGVLDSFSAYGNALGLAFQVVDDVLDATADSATLGKTAGKDQADDKPTYVSLMGVDVARSYAQSLHQQALDALVASALPAQRWAALKGLADFVVQRSH